MTAATSAAGSAAFFAAALRAGLAGAGLADAPFAAAALPADGVLVADFVGLAEGAWPAFAAGFADEAFTRGDTVADCLLAATDDLSPQVHADGRLDASISAANTPAQWGRRPSVGWLRTRVQYVRSSLP